MRPHVQLAATTPAGSPLVMPAPPSPAGKLLVAQRGASAYAPEHTLAAYRLAIEQGADFIEQDLVVTKDGVLICLHDASLDRTTDVRAKFPGRSSYLAADFTLAEIRTLDAGSWFHPRFAGARVPTFDEVVELVGRRAGLFLELTEPALYRSRNVDMPGLVDAAVKRHGLHRPAAATPVFLQSFDEPSIRALKARLPDVPRALLFDAPAAKRYGTADGLRELARWATAIGPARGVLESDPGVVTRAHALGMQVMPWTFRATDAGRFTTVTEEMWFFLETFDVDGVFTDSPDRFPFSARGRRPPLRMARATVR